MKTFILSLLLVASFSLKAQISGKVTDTSGLPLEGATLSLLRASDSAVIKLMVSDKEGSWSVMPLSDSIYLVRATYAGYNQVFSKPIHWKGHAIITETLKLSPVMTELQAAVIVAKKPIIEVKQDKIIMNVEGTLNESGTDALDILRKSPGVFIDKDDRIQMNGKSGVQVFIDGKPSPLTGNDLANYLRSLQSSQIASIELITNPSAKYEAAGNAGIINIRLRKNLSMGINGSVHAGYNIGKYGKFNSGFSLNYRNQRLNLFGNYDFDKSKNENELTISRILKDSVFNTFTTIMPDFKRHNFKTGADFFINKHHTLGAIVSGNLSDNMMFNSGATSVQDISGQNKTNTLTTNQTDAGRDQLTYNLNYQYNGNKGKSLSVNGDFAEYHNRSDQLQRSSPDDDGLPYTRLLEILSPGDIYITSGKADWEQALGQGRLSAGIKSSFVHSDNDFRQYDLKTGSSQLDGKVSNRFRYDEDIHSAYGIFNRQFKGFGIQAGLRVERTISKGLSTGYDGREDQVLRKDYTDLFPSASVSLNKNPMQQWTMSYSRRIDRPSYQQLNPFEVSLDEYTVVKGNMYLKPQYTNNIGLTFLYKLKGSASLNYSHVANMMAPLTDTTEHNKLAITTDNLASQRVISFNLSYPFQYRQLSLFTNLNTNYAQYKANFGAGRQVNLDAFALSAVMQGSYAFADNWTAQMTSFYNAPTVFQGSFKAQSLWSVDLGVQHQLFNKRMNIKATVSDVFNSLHFVGKSDFAGQKTTVHSNWESRQFKINLSYRFGRKEIKPSRQRKTGLDEEGNRAKSSGGGINIGQ